MDENKKREYILDNIDIAVYVTDLITDEVIFSNKELNNIFLFMKKEGQRCWEVLHNRNDRCEFCRIPYLLKNPGKSYRGRYYDGESGRHFLILDSLIPWPNGKGKMAHLSCYVDIS